MQNGLSITLEDKIWAELEGGYRCEYDASIALKRLEATTSPAGIKEIWDELWNELHHQGDVGIASYLALPQIVRIANNHEYFNVDAAHLCITIEQCRLGGSNPELPARFQAYYEQGLKELYAHALKHINLGLEGDELTMAMAVLATCKGNTKMGIAMVALCDDDILEEFIEAI